MYCFTSHYIGYVIQNLLSIAVCITFKLAMTKGFHEVKYTMHGMPKIMLLVLVKFVNQKGKITYWLCTMKIIPIYVKIDLQSVTFGLGIKS